jgi:hypothetical protein
VGRRGLPTGFHQPAERAGTLTEIDDGDDGRDRRLNGEEDAEVGLPDDGAAEDAVMPRKELRIPRNPCDGILELPEEEIAAVAASGIVVGLRGPEVGFDVLENLDGLASHDFAKRRPSSSRVMRFVFPAR